MQVFLFYDINPFLFEKIFFNLRIVYKSLKSRCYKSPVLKKNTNLFADLHSGSFIKKTSNPIFHYGRQSFFT